MKKLITLFVFMAFTLVIMAQAPGKMSYQALVRDSNNKLIPDSNIGMQISILQSSAEGTALYVERHFPSTNSNGLVTVEIGGGTIVSGDIIGIDWANGPYFIKTETDLNGGANYTISGTSQLLSVPYSLHSNTAENVITENDPVFGASAASGITNTNISNWNNKLDSEVDGSITNELQTLSLTGKTLSISSKNSVELPFFELTNNSIGSQHIINGTIKNEDVSATANIDISKILGTSGVAFSFPTTFKSWSNGTYQIQTLTTITMDIPKDGYVLLIHSGYVVFFSFNRTMDVGIGTSSTEILNGVRVGTLDGSSTNRYEEAYSAAYVVQVAAGTHTFYALAEGNSVFKTGSVNVSPSSFIGVFIPKKY
jgi:hypothetical protein